jgi:hypothetical protein
VIIDDRISGTAAARPPSLDQPGLLGSMGLHAASGVVVGVRPRKTCSMLQVCLAGMNSGGP